MLVTEVWVRGGDPSVVLDRGTGLEGASSSSVAVTAWLEGIQPAVDR